MKDGEFSINQKTILIWKRAHFLRIRNRLELFTSSTKKFKCFIVSRTRVNHFLSLSKSINPFKTLMLVATLLTKIKIISRNKRFHMRDCQDLLWWHLSTSKHFHYIFLSTKIAIKTYFFWWMWALFCDLTIKSQIIIFCGNVGIPLKPFTIAFKWRLFEWMWKHVFHLKQLYKYLFLLLLLFSGRIQTIHLEHNKIFSRIQYLELETAMATNNLNPGIKVSLLVMGL